MPSLRSTSTPSRVQCALAEVSPTSAVPPFLRVRIGLKSTGRMARLRRAIRPGVWFRGETVRTLGW